MKFNKLSNKVKLSSSLIAATTVIGATILSVPLLLSTNNNNKQITSSNLDYKNLINQNNNQTNILELNSQPAEIQSFFLNEKTKIYASNDSDSYFAVVSHENTDVLYAWGYNTASNLGLGNAVSQLYPIKVTNNLPSTYRITHLVATLTATTLVINNRDIWNVGSNVYNEFGDAKTTTISRFVQNTAWSGGAIKSLHAGARHRVVVTESGNAYVWGYNNLGQLGIGPTPSSAPTPVEITTTLNQRIPNWAAGNFFASGSNTGILVDGKLYIWGDNQFGQLATSTGTASTPPTVPVAIPIPGKITKYAMGHSHSVAVIEDKKLYTWGRNNKGQLGNNSTTDVRTPVWIERSGNGFPLTDFTHVNAAEETSYVSVKSASYACGNNNLGMTGSGATNLTIPQFAPMPKLADEAASASVINLVAAQSSIIVNHKSGLYMAGSNQYGQFANGATSTAINATLGLVDPAGTPPGLVTKLNNKSFLTKDVVADLNSKTTAADIKTALAKYVDGIETLGGTVLKYKTLPIASEDLTQVTLTLTSNSRFNLDGVKTNTEFDIPLVISNFSFKDSAFVLDAIISEDLNKDNIKAKLQTGLPIIEDKYLSMFVEKDTFPIGTTFTIHNSDIDVNNKTYSGVLSFNKYYENDELKTNGSRNFTLTNLKTIKDSQMFFNGLKDDSIHSANIEELLSAVDNTDIMNKLFDTNRFPPNSKFIILGNPIINEEMKTFSGKLLASLAYENWAVVANKELTYEVWNITIVKNSSIDYLKMPSGYDINNIETSLKDSTGININELSKFIKTNRFPPHTTFTMGVTNKDVPNGQYIFEMIPSRHYVNGIAINNDTTKTPYSVTIQFAVPDTSVDLGLIIGLSVGGAALLAIFILAYFKRYELQVIWWHIKAIKYRW